MTEKDLQKSITQAAKTFGWRVYHTYNSRRSEPGFPDLVMVRGSRVIFAELKTAKGRISDAQTEWLTALSRTHSEVYLWRPADLEDAFRVLAPLDKSKPANFTLLDARPR